MFTSVQDSAPGLRDEIMDFSRAEGDVIDLSMIDAVPGGTDDAFTPVGAFTNTAGELVISDVGGGVVRVALDLDGDAVADMEFDAHGQADLNAEDFIL